ncbi:MEDS domain-containing protein [Nocardioides sp.]|uniref:MEDS domain-containing protein n=1 Tax=Nocardioides sp. TaxID=35761 RepID=UPI0037851B05
MSRELEHDALLHDGPDHLASVGRSFVRDGLARGEHVLLVCDGDAPADPLSALGADLGDGGRVEVLPRSEPPLKVAAVVDRYRRFATRARSEHAPGARVVGTVATGSDPESLRRLELLETMCNLALGGLPLWAVCAYDLRTTSPEVLGAVGRTHPVLRRDGRRDANPGYIGPSGRLGELQLRRVPGVDPVLDLPRLHTPGDVIGARRRLRRVLELSGTSPDVRDAAVISVGELTANALVHGTSPVALAVWVEPDRVVCTVSDRGGGTADVGVGYGREDETVPGVLGPSGLWLVRRLVDDLSLHHRAGWFVARIEIGVPAADAIR